MGTATAMGSADIGVDLAIDTVGELGGKSPSYHVDDLSLPALHAPLGAGQSHEDRPALPPTLGEEEETRRSQAPTRWEEEGMIMNRPYMEDDRVMDDGWLE